MKYSIVLLCIVLGIFALVDASLVGRRSDLVDKREPHQGRNRQCESQSSAPAAAAPSSPSDQAPSAPPAILSSAADVLSIATTKTLADSGKVGGGRRGRGGRGGQVTTTDAAAATDVAATDTPSATDVAATDATAATTTDAAAGATDTPTTTSGNGGNGGGNGGGGSGNGSPTCLAADALQTGSEITGQNVANITAGQVESETDDANFINVCSGQTLTNGKQVTTGSCNGIPLGFIPAKDKMPSSMIIFPQHNQDIPADQTFNIQIITTNMELGHFTNAQLTYYSAPTRLNAAGLIIGHTHITCQDLGGSFTPSTALDSSKFAFFLGINTPADANSQVIAKVPNGLPAGFYRCCTMVANSNHSPLQMPVAQRGSQDDCRYFSVGQTGSNAATGAGAGAGSGTGTGTAASSAAADPAASTDVAAAATSAAAGKRRGRGGRGGRGGN